MLFHCGSSQVIEYSFLTQQDPVKPSYIKQFTPANPRFPFHLSPLPLAISECVCLFVVELEGFFTYSATISLWKGNHIVSYIQRHSDWIPVSSVNRRFGRIQVWLFWQEFKGGPWWTSSMRPIVSGVVLFSDVWAATDDRFLDLQFHYKLAKRSFLNSVIHSSFMGWNTLVWGNFPSAAVILRYIQFTEKHWLSKCLILSVSSFPDGHSPKGTN